MVTVRRCGKYEILRLPGYPYNDAYVLVHNSDWIMCFGVEEVSIDVPGSINGKCRAIYNRDCSGKIYICINSPKRELIHHIDANPDNVWVKYAYDPVAFLALPNGELKKICNTIRKLFRALCATRDLTIENVNLKE